MDFTRLFIPAFIACCCNAVANLFWKLRLDKEPISSLKDIIGLIGIWQIWIGVMFYGCSMLLFFYMLSNFKLSSIMPVTCLTYVLNIIVARIIFKENISVMQIIGTLIIIFGLIILSRGQVSKI